MIFRTDTLANRIAEIEIDPANNNFQSSNVLTDRTAYIRTYNYGEIFMAVKQLSNDSTIVSIELDDTIGVIMIGIKDYASDAAADADGGLLSGSVYTVYAEDRTMRIKP
jgi:hypothetical protein